MSWSVPLLLAVAASAAPGAPAPVITPPAVTLQAVPERKSLETHERMLGDSWIDELPVAVVVLNNSAHELRNLELHVASKDFRVTTVALAPRLAPYGSFLGRVTLRPQPKAGHGHKDLAVLVRYRWTAGSAEVVSAQTATVGVDIKRPFEDEAAGLPGGTAALFTLLLPLFPAFFAYQLVDRWRKGEGLQVPAFGSEYVFPAFFIGLLANSLGLLWPRGYVLLGAAILGALWPLSRWAWELYQRKRWAFHETDTDVEYLRKVLLGPRAPRRFLRVTGEVEGETWSGLSLAQPDGDFVLGATLQITCADESQHGEIKRLVDLINRGAAGKTDRMKLVTKITDKKWTISQPHQAIFRGGQKQSELVTEVIGFTQKSVERVVLLTFSP